MPSFFPAAPADRPARTPLAMAIALLFAWISSVAGPAAACDLMAGYTAVDFAERGAGPWVGLTEQYTMLGTLQQDGEAAANPLDQKLSSSVTQLVAGYQITPRFGLQLNLPLIYRSWRRPYNGRIQSSTKASIGDLALLGNFLAYEATGEDGAFRASAFGGLKLPTGSAAFLGEEQDHGDDHEGGGHGGHMHGDDTGDEVASGIHGHDLAFGSGSVDGIVGGQLYGKYRRGFASATLQYVARTEGSFDYQYANSLTWQAGPGTFLILDHDRSLSLQAVLSGETKGLDTVDGQSLDDTGATYLFFGPDVTFTSGQSVFAEVAADFPVVEHNTGLQVVPDYRLRATLIWRF